jgi:hypothetical protein
MLFTHAGNIPIITRSRRTDAGVYLLQLPEHAFDGSRGSNVYPDISAVPACKDDLMPLSQRDSHCLSDGAMTTDDQYFHIFFTKLALPTGWPVTQKAQ